MTVFSLAPNFVKWRAPVTLALCAVTRCESLTPMRSATALQLLPKALAVSGRPDSVHAKKVDGVASDNILNLLSPQRGQVRCALQVHVTGSLLIFTKPSCWFFRTPVMISVVSTSKSLT